MKINKTILSAVLATAALGLTANANAVNADAENSCPGCHGVVINGMQAVGSGGGKNCAPRSEAEWVVTIDRMNGKNCGASNVAGIAKYLFAFGTTTNLGTTTTTTLPVTTTTTTTLPVTTTTTTTTTLPTTTTTTTTLPVTTTTTLPVTTTSTTTTVPVTTTTTTTPQTTNTTVATTTTTTSGCNTYVNGTTQYPYSGSGSCHGHGDDGTGNHIVQNQKWCQKHVLHMNSSGSHAHAYPHPRCL